MELCAFSGQSLKDHTCGTVSIAKKYSTQQYIRSCVKRLNASGCSISYEELDMSISLAALLHDFGKALPKYQKQFDLSCRCINETEPSFYLHELFSAALARRITRAMKMREESSFLITTAVLQHLHSMRSFDTKFKPLNIRDLLNEFRNDELNVSVYSKELCDIFDTVARRIDVNAASELAWFEALSKKDVLETVEFITNVSMSRRNTWAKLYVFVLNPVMIGDNLDAEKGRVTRENQNRISFISELKRALKWYEFGDS